MRSPLISTWVAVASVAEMTCADAAVTGKKAPKRGSSAMEVFLFRGVEYAECVEALFTSETE